MIRSHIKRAHYSLIVVRPKGGKFRHQEDFHDLQMDTIHLNTFFAQTTGENAQAFGA